MTDHTRQAAYQNRKQREGWQRVSALLEPEHVKLWKDLAARHGSIAEAMRVLASDATGGDQ